MKEVKGGKGRRDTEMGEQTGRPPGQKHKLGGQKRNKRRENPKHKTCPKIPPQGQPGRSSNQLPLRVHNHQRKGLLMGKVQVLEVEPRTGICL